MSRIEKGIYKRGPLSFQVRLSIDGFSVSATFDTIQEARAYRDRTRADFALDPNVTLVLESRVKKNEAKSLTLDDALQRYEKEVSAAKKSASREKHRINKLRRTKQARMSLFRIRPDDIDDLLSGLRFEKGERNGQPITDTTKRIYAMLLSHLFNIAKKRWRLPIENPVQQIELPKPKAGRIRRLEGDEEARMFDELEKCKHAAIVVPLFHFAIQTAARLGELLKLEWQDIKINGDHGTMLLRDTKNGEDRIVPLTIDAITAIRSLPAPGKNGKVFPISESNVRYARSFALQRAGIADLRFHDLRHEATSRLFELGLDSMEASAITGHKTLAMLKRYTHLRPEDLARKLNQAKQVGF